MLLTTNHIIFPPADPCGNELMSEEVRQRLKAGEELPVTNKLCACHYCACAADPYDAELMSEEVRQRLKAGEELPVGSMKIPMVDLPLGATEDRVCGTIDIEKALTEGERTRLLGDACITAIIK
jgi:hypothetical protein